MIPYDGGASQVWVLDVPLVRLESVIGQFSDRALETTVLTLNGYNFGSAENARSYGAIPADLLLPRNQVLQSVLIGTFDASRQIQFWMWPDLEKGTFDAELTFFGDEFFAVGGTDAANMQSFELVYFLAEMMRAEGSHCRCAITPLETADPRNEKDAASMIFW